MDNKKLENTEEAIFSHVYFYKILFKDKPQLPNIELIKQKLRSIYNNVETISEDKNLYSIMINDLKVKFKDDKELGVQVFMYEPIEFDYNSISDEVYNQAWDIKNAKEILKECKYQVMLSDFLAGGLDYKDRTTLLNNWLNIALNLFPDATAVYNEQSGKILLREQLLKNQYPKNLRFLYSGLNIRFFKVQNTNDMIVDTFGLYSIGLSDIQYHFHDLNPNNIIQHAMNIAAYIFENGNIIKSNDEIESIFSGVKWLCRYEKSLTKPNREILDINTLEYASGKRN